MTMSHDLIQHDPNLLGFCGFSVLILVLNRRYKEKFPRSNEIQRFDIAASKFFASEKAETNRIDD